MSKNSVRVEAWSDRQRRSSRD